jgi:hypothetical protein
MPQPRESVFRGLQIGKELAIYRDWSYRLFAGIAAVFRQLVREIVVDAAWKSREVVYLVPRALPIERYRTADTSRIVGARNQAMNRRLFETSRRIVYTPLAATTT